VSLECVGTNVLTVIHMGTGSGGPGWVIGGNGASYVMPDWASRLASNNNNHHHIFVCVIHRGIVISVTMFPTFRNLKLMS